VARVPVEIAVTGDVVNAEVSSAAALANAEQEEFMFMMAEEELQLRVRMHSYTQVQVKEFFDRTELVRSEIRGYHPFVITVVDSYIQGARYGNLFGSHRANAGLAIITAAEVADSIVPADRMIAYYIYYFARYSLSFLSPHHRNHEDSRGCIFDRKVDKTDIKSSMRANALCDECRRSLVSGDGRLSPRQFAALDQLFALAATSLEMVYEMATSRPIAI